MSIEKITRFVVKETYSDDDGNLGCDITIHKTKEEALKKVKEIHDDRAEQFSCYYGEDETDYGDSYDDGDEYFDIYLEDDSAICVNVSIAEVEIDL